MYTHLFDYVRMCAYIMSIRMHRCTCVCTRPCLRLWAGKCRRDVKRKLFTPTCKSTWLIQHKPDCYVRITYNGPLSSSQRDVTSPLSSLSLSLFHSTPAVNRIMATVNELILFCDVGEWRSCTRNRGQLSIVASRNSSRQEQGDELTD